MSVAVPVLYFCISEKSERSECTLYRQDIIPGENVPVLICAGLAPTILGYHHRRRLQRELIRNISKTK